MGLERIHGTFGHGGTLYRRLTDGVAVGCILDDNFRDLREPDANTGDEVELWGVNVPLWEEVPPDYEDMTSDIREWGSTVGRFVSIPED